MTDRPAESSGLDDFDVIVAALNRRGAEYMIIGGFAVVFHGYVRATEDMDLFVRPTEENARRVVAALEDAGFGCPELTAGVFTADNGISIGEAPVTVDILARLPGVSFEEAWGRRETGAFGAETACFISREDLIKNKRAVGRPRDMDDVRELEAGRDTK